MNSAKQVIQTVKNRRRFDEANEQLRSRIRKCNGSAFRSFAFALYFIWLAYKNGISVHVDGHDVLTKDVINLVIAGLLITSGLEQFNAKAQDKILLLITEEALARLEKSESE